MLSFAHRTAEKATVLRIRPHLRRPKYLGGPNSSSATMTGRRRPRQHSPILALTHNATLGGTKLVRAIIEHTRLQVANMIGETERCGTLQTERDKNEWPQSQQTSIIDIIGIIADGILQNGL